MPSEVGKEPGDLGRVLIIDDDPLMLDVLSQMLRDEGYKIDNATRGKDGVDIFKKYQHDVVLTDLKLGDMTGLDVLRSVRDVNSDSAVIILTGYASTESAVEAVRLGANDYLTKPVRMLDLIKSVKNQISSVRLSKQVKVLNKKVSDERDKLKRSVAELELLKRLAARMVSILSFTEGFEVILNLLVEEAEADVAVIFDLERGTSRFSSSGKPSRKDLKYLADIIVKQCKEELGAEVKCSDDDFVGLDRVKESSIKGDIVSTIVVPLVQEERPFGLLVVASKHDAEYKVEWSDFVSTLARDASEFLSIIKRSVERQRHFTSTIVEHTLDGIVVIDPGSGEVMMNPVASGMLDLGSGPTVGMDDVAAKFEIDLKEIWDELTDSEVEDTASRTTQLQCDLTIRDRAVYYRLNVSTLPDEETEAGRLLIVIHDVTQERSVEEMKNRLISNITHEVRTPTGVIKEFISLILDGVAGELTDTQRQYIGIMHTNIERLSRLIENLLTLARAESGGFTVVLKPTELAPIIETVTASMEVKLRRKNISCFVDLPDELPLVFADQDAVTQILTNLVDNSFKYSPNDTNINISAIVKGANVEIQVKDQGYGISPADKEAIFSRFHRLVDQNDPRFQEGVGLGLALVKDLITRHGGDIWVDSEVGVGSVFHIKLQVAEEDEEHRPA